MRPKSREETPKEGIGQKACPIASLWCNAQKSSRAGRVVAPDLEGRKT